MKQIKIRYFIHKYRKVITLILILFFIICLWYTIVKMDSNKLLLENPTLFGVIGTLIGALIGGTFSLLGSIWINSKQQKSQQSIKKKNIIYSPIYDELVNIQNNIYTVNPYPSRIAFDNEWQAALPFPHYTAWERIKSDTRFLEVPEVLRKQMEKLEKSIELYISVRDKVNIEVQDIFNKTLQKNNLPLCSIQNIGDVLSSDILKNHKKDLYHEAFSFSSNDNIEQSLKDSFNEQVYAECNQNEIIIDLRIKQTNLLKVHKDTVDMLSLLIKTVLLKYEG